MRSGLSTLLALLVGCGSSAASGPDDGGLVSCNDDPRVDTYVPHLTRQSDSGALSVEISASTPAPPARGDNSWTVVLKGHDGNAVTGAAVEVVPFMPDHGHGTTVTPVVTQGGDGAYSIESLYLFMPGVWRISIADESGASPADTANFYFCIPG